MFMSVKILLAVARGKSLLKQKSLIFTTPYSVTVRLGDNGKKLEVHKFSDSVSVMFSGKVESKLYFFFSMYD